MKKMNKKGFTLAELLIVIAIIAVLIAIAIPTFAGALENARRQTDHANIRNAYAMVQAANLQDGDFYTEAGVLDSSKRTVTELYFQQDGTLAATGDGDYVLKADHANDNNCTTSIPCKNIADSKTAKAGTAKIKLVRTTAGTTTAPGSADWKVVLDPVA